MGGIKSLVQFIEVKIGNLGWSGKAHVLVLILLHLV